MELKVSVSEAIAFIKDVKEEPGPFLHKGFLK